MRAKLLVASACVSGLCFAFLSNKKADFVFLSWTLSFCPRYFSLLLSVLKLLLYWGYVVTFTKGFAIYHG
jgi:hypothetical protein